MPDFEFYDDNPHALRKTGAVTRDSLGFLAVQILAAQTDLSDVSDYQELIFQLHDIVGELQNAFHRCNLG